jgi:hypothetical protein
MINRDNQQETVTAFELGWLSGIIEGEGSVCLQIHKRKGRVQTLRVTPKIILTNSDKDLIEKCVEILSKIGVGKYVQHTRPNKGSFMNATKDMVYIHISGMKRIRKLLESLKMFGEKQKRAEILKKFIDRRLSEGNRMEKGGNYHYDQADVDNMIEFINLTKSPNKSFLNRLLNDYTQGHKTRELCKI